MKLYTEEQVREAIDIAEYRIFKCDQILNRLTPIELPSDKEIGKQTSSLLPFNASLFERGAKWTIEYILNQNK